MALVIEEAALQQGAGRDDAGRGVGVHPEQLELAGDELSDHLRVGGRPRPAAVHVGGEVVDLLAVLLCHLRPRRGAGVGPQDDAVFVDHADDGGAGLLGGRQGPAPLQAQQLAVAQGVFEREARRGGGGGGEFRHGILWVL